jgi:multidrug resistance efflux pump
MNYSIDFKQYKNEYMKRIIYVLLLTTLITACSKKTEKATVQKGDSTSVKLTEIVGVGKVEPEKNIINLAATSGGVVVQVLKDDGDSVNAGDALVRLNDEIEQLKINQLKSQIQSQHSQIDIEQNNAKNAGLKLANKKQLLNSTQNLVKNGAETQQVYTDLSTEVKTLEFDNDKAKSTVVLAQSRLNELTQQLKQAQVEAAEKILRAPYAGTVLNMIITKGAAINQFATYAEFAPRGKKIIRSEVDEMFCQDLKVGQKVDIRIAGNNKVIATGTIKLLSPYLKKKSLFSEKANDQEDRRVREIKVLLTDDSNLLINSKVECVIKF